jgi:hypothetical protein
MESKYGKECVTWPLHASCTVLNVCGATQLMSKTDKSLTTLSNWLVAKYQNYMLHVHFYVMHIVTCGELLSHHPYPFMCWKSGTLYYAHSVLNIAATLTTV